MNVDLLSHLPLMEYAVIGDLLPQIPLIVHVRNGALLPQMHAPDSTCNKWSFAATNACP